MATDSSIISWRTPMDRGTWQAAAHGGLKETYLKQTSMHAFYFIKLLRLHTISSILPKIIRHISKGENVTHG